MAKNDNLKDYLTDLYEGIKTKKPDASRNPQDFKGDILSIETGVSLDPLTNPATAEQILTGRETYDSNGNKVTGTMNDNGQINLTIDGITNENINIPEGYTEGGVVSLTSDIQNEVDTQEDLIDEIIDIVNNKMMGDNADVLKGLIDRSITEIVIPEGITEIGKYALSYMLFLTNIEIPNSVISIGEGAFTYCKSITNIEIPNSVRVIGESVFESCSNLTSVKIPNSVGRLGGSVFGFCTNLITVIIGNGIDRIEPNVFSNCSKLTNVTIGNGVKSIGAFAFSKCSELTYLTIPANVTRFESGSLSIGSSTNKATIRFESTTPPTITTSTFSASYLQAIEVPMSAVETYKTATNWSNFADYIVGY